MSRNTNRIVDGFMASEKHHVRCTECGMEMRSRLWTPGDIHKADGGEFVKVIED